MTSSATTTAAKPTAADPKAAADEGADLPPGLLDVCSLVLPFFDSAEVARRCLLLGPAILRLGGGGSTGIDVQDLGGNHHRLVPSLGPTP